MLPLVLCVGETWSVTLREEHRLRVFENMVVLRKIVGPKRDEVTGEWRRQHNEELYIIYIIRVLKKTMRWVGHVAHMGREKCVQDFGGET